MLMAMYVRLVGTFIKNSTFVFLAYREIITYQAEKKHHLGLVLHIGIGQNQKHFGPRIDYPIFDPYLRAASCHNFACPEELVLRHVYPVTMRVQHLSVILRDTMCVI